MSAIEALSAKRLCFTVTSGRSGTKLLATLLRSAAGLCVEHEPAPRLNYVLRTMLECPDAAKWWLLTEKLPATAALAGESQHYGEMSHLTCKGFIEPLVELGLRPAFLIISRPAREVATSLLKIGAVPERASAGRLVLIGPQYSPFLPLKEWEQLTDYQLCYRYAREIECRQEHYRSYFTERGLHWRDCTIHDMTKLESFKPVCEFVAGTSVACDASAFEEILQLDQNPRSGILQGAPEFTGPADPDEEEAEVERLAGR